MAQQSLDECCQGGSLAHWDVHRKPLWERVLARALGRRAKKGKTALCDKQEDAGRIGLDRMGARKECFAVLARQMCRDRTAWGARWLKVLLSISIKATCMLGTSAQRKHCDLSVSMFLGLSGSTVCLQACATAG